MTFFDAGGSRKGFVKTLKAGAAEVTSTTHSATSTKNKSVVTVNVVVTATSGTPTLTVAVEGSRDGSTWIPLGTIGSDGYSVGSVADAPANITTSGTHRGVYPALGYVRTKSTVGGGTPSLTYSVTAEVS